MKKSFLALFIFLATMQFAKAQLSVGGMAGVNYSNIVANNGSLNQSEYTPYYFIGATTSIPLTNKINFLGDVAYALKGYKINFGINSSEFKLRASYLDLMPKIEFRPMDFLGIAVGVNLGVNVGESSKSGTGVWQKAAPGFRTLNSNFAIIGELRGYIGNFFIAAGYSHGLNIISTLVLTDANGNPIQNSRSYLRNFNLGAGYLFEL